MQRNQKSIVYWGNWNETDLDEILLSFYKESPIGSEEVLIAVIKPKLISFSFIMVLWLSWNLIDSKMSLGKYYS